MDTLKQRLKYLVELLGKGKHTVFARHCGIPPSSFQAYIKGERIPSTGHLVKIISVYGINLNWLLVGKGQPFIEDGTQEIQEKILVKIPASDPVEQLLFEEEERAGISLTAEQHRAFLKMFRELVHRDVHTLRELLGVIPRGGEKGEED